MAKTQAYYYIGSMDGVYTKVYDGKKLQADVITYSGYKDGDTKVPGITNDSITHVSSQNLLMEVGYPQVYRDGVNVTDDYNQTQVKDPTFEDLTPGYNTFTITARDITLQSATISKEYDGTALTAYSQTGGTDITDLTAGVTNKGYVTSAISGKGYDEQFNYAYTGSQLFVGSSDNVFTVSDSSTALTTDYNVTKQYGKLTVTKRTTPLTITVNDQERLYDGTATINTDSSWYTVEGELANGDTLTVTLTNKDGSVNAGTYADGISATYKIMHGDTDVTDMYANVTVNAGDLIINKRSVTITSDSDSKPYDGTPLTNGNTSVTAGDGFVSGEGYTATVTGSQTVPGTSKNTFTYTLDSNTKADNYNITTVEGDLTVTGVDLTITIGLDATTGLSYLYDGTATKVLSEGEYQVAGLAVGDKLANVTITTGSANVGVYNDDQALTYTVSYDIVNAAGVSVKDNYEITLNKNDVTITPRYITIEAGSDSKVYDGTALTCTDWALAEGGDGLVAGEKIDGVKMTADSTITHVGSTANKVDATGVTISKADGSDSSMNYVVDTLDGTLTTTKRRVLLISTSADKFYDGTALQNRQVIVTGLSFLEGQPVGADEGFLPGDGCTYDFVNDDVVVDAAGNIIAWTVSEQSNTAYGQTDVGTSVNEFNYHNFTSVYYDSNESDYEIIYGNAVPTWFVDKYGQEVADALFGDLTVWGGPVEINMTDYSWTYDYQAKTNGYFDDGYSVKFTTTEDGTGSETTSFAHNSLGQAVALFGKDTIVVTVAGQGGDVATGKVQHVSDGEKQNTATYTIYRDGYDVTEEVKDYYQISIDGGVLKITPRTVELTSGSASKLWDGTPLTDNTVTEGSEGLLTGFVFGEGAAYEVTGSQTDVGASANTFAISKFLIDTQATDYTFVMNEGTLVVYVPRAEHEVWGQEEKMEGEEDFESVLVAANGSLSVVEGGTLATDELLLNNGTFNAADGQASVGVIVAEGDEDANTQNAIVGNIAKREGVENTVTVEKGATLALAQAQYDDFFNWDSFSSEGVLEVSGDGVTQADVEKVFKQGQLRNVQFKQDLAGVGFLTLNAKEATAVGYENGYGTDGYDILNVMANSERIELGTAGGTTDLGKGANLVLVGSNADLKVKGTLENAQMILVNSGTYFWNAEESKIELGQTNAAFDAVKTGSYNDVLNVGAFGSMDVTGDVDFGAGINTMTVGYQSKVTVGGDVKGVYMLNVAGGSADKAGIFAAGGVEATGYNDVAFIGNYAQAKIGTADFGEGFDTLVIGSYSDVQIDELKSAEVLSVGAFSTAVLKSEEGVSNLMVGYHSKLYVTDELAKSIPSYVGQIEGYAEVNCVGAFDDDFDRALEGAFEASSAFDGVLYGKADELDFIDVADKDGMIALTDLNGETLASASLAAYNADGDLLAGWDGSSLDGVDAVAVKLGDDILDYAKVDYKLTITNGIG